MVKRQEPSLLIMQVLIFATAGWAAFAELIGRLLQVKRKQERQNS